MYFRIGTVIGTLTLTLININRKSKTKRTTTLDGKQMETNKSRAILVKSCWTKFYKHCGLNAFTNQCKHLQSAIVFSGNAERPLLF